MVPRAPARLSYSLPSIGQIGRVEVSSSSVILLSHGSGAGWGQNTDSLTHEPYILIPARTLKKIAPNPGTELELLVESVRPLGERQAKQDRANDAQAAVEARTEPATAPRFVPLLDAFRERERVPQLQREVERLRAKEIPELHREIERLRQAQRQIPELHHEIERLREIEQQIPELHREIERLRGIEQQIPELHHEIERLRGFERQIPELHRELLTREQTIKQLGIEKQRQVAELERQIELHLEKERQIPALHQQVEALREQVSALREQEARLPELHRQISSLRDKEREIPELRQQLARLQRQLVLSAQKERVIPGLRLELASALAARKTAEASAQALRASTSWRLTAPIRWLLDLLRGGVAGSIRRNEP